MIIWSKVLKPEAQLLVDQPEDEEGLDVGAEPVISPLILPHPKHLRSLPVQYQPPGEPTVMELTLRLEDCITNLSAQLGVVVQRS